MMRFMWAWMWFDCRVCLEDLGAPIASKLAPTVDLLSTQFCGWPRTKCGSKLAPTVDLLNMQFCGWPGPNVGASLLAMASVQSLLFFLPTACRDHLHAHARCRQIHSSLIQMPLERQIERP